MSLLYGVKAVQNQSAANKPHIFGFTTARSAANDTLVEVWNAATNAGIKAAIDKDGKYYSNALTAGDILYAVAGGVSNVLRLDSLAIGAANTVLTSSGSAPQWSTALTLGGALTASGLITASAGLTVASGQTLTLTGVTVTGAPTWGSNQAITLSTAAQPNITSVGTLTALACSGTLTVDTINEYTGAAGVTIDGVLLKDKGIQVDQGTDLNVRPLMASRDDVAHGMTDYAPTNCFGHLQYQSSADGGLLISGFCESAEAALTFYGNGTGESTAKSAAGSGTVEMRAYKANGVGRQALAANGNCLAVRNGSGTVFIVDADGDIHMDATSNENAWDSHDDVALLTGLRGSLMSPKAQLARDWREFIDYARPILEKTGVVTYNEDGHHFIATKRLNMLLIDTIRQLAGRIEGLERRNPLA